MSKMLAILWVTITAVMTNFYGILGADWPNNPPTSTPFNAASAATVMSSILLYKPSFFVRIRPLLTPHFRRLASSWRTRVWT